MGRFHCVTDGCAEVWYREFLPERLEYQYPGEEIQTIEGKNLTYTVEQEPPPFTGGQCSNVSYDVQIKAYSSHLDHCYTYDYQFVYANLTGPILGLELVPTSSSYNGAILHNIGIRHGNNQLFTSRQVWISTRCGNNDRAEIIAVTKTDGSPDNCGNVQTDCLLSVYSHNNLVFTRTESSCPTVNYFPSQPSDEWKTIKIPKEPTWEKIQVVDNNSWNELISELKEFINGNIPDECIEIWKTPILDLDILPGNTRAEKYQFIGQYCSPTGCPPPEYQVICRDTCEAEKCPPGTCEVECTDHLCCYDSEGIAILTIDK